MSGYAWDDWSTFVKVNTEADQEYGQLMQNFNCVQGGIGRGDDVGHTDSNPPTMTLLEALRQAQSNPQIVAVTYNRKNHGRPTADTKAVVYFKSSGGVQTGTAAVSGYAWDDWSTFVKH